MSFRQLKQELQALSELVGARLRRSFHRPLSPRRRASRNCCLGFDRDALLATPVNDARIVVLDTETTGMQPYAGDGLVEIALIEYHGLVPTGREFCSLIHPGRPIPPETTAIHGLGDADVVDAPSLERVLDDIVAFLDGALLVGHHIGFDLRFLNRATLRHLHCQLPFPALNTMVLFQAWTGRHSVFSLDDVAEACGVTVTDRHNARGDALVCGEIFRVLATSLTAPDATVADLLAISPPDPEYGPHYSRPAARRDGDDGAD
ncbi:3'-5' exonuclease [Aquisalimonas sp.]|uniref:3'-5' exonuclease n=1 Tax=unclassified Aquisalimonas TaxID=2644645 RepID=UPI0025BF5569|nr:3'-5' exonuclease [Aquisalimonas sp.]